MLLKQYSMLSLIFVVYTCCIMSLPTCLLLSTNDYHYVHMHIMSIALWNKARKRNIVWDYNSVLVYIVKANYVGNLMLIVTLFLKICAKEIELNSRISFFIFLVDLRNIINLCVRSRKNPASCRGKDIFITVYHHMILRCFL